jgi:hypothetical protein
MSTKSEDDERRVEMSDVEDEDMSFAQEEDLNALLQTYFMEDKKDRNIVDVLLELRRSLDTQNKIMMKVLEVLQK